MECSIYKNMVRLKAVRRQKEKCRRHCLFLLLETVDYEMSQAAKEIADTHNFV